MERTEKAKPSRPAQAVAKQTLVTIDHGEPLPDDDEPVPEGLTRYRIKYDEENHERVFVVAHPCEIPEPHLSFIRTSLRHRYELLRPLYEPPPNPHRWN